MERDESGIMPACGRNNLANAIQRQGLQASPKGKRYMMINRERLQDFYRTRHYTLARAGIHFTSMYQNY